MDDLIEDLFGGPAAPARPEMTSDRATWINLYRDRILQFAPNIPDNYLEDCAEVAWRQDSKIAPVVAADDELQYWQENGC